MQHVALCCRANMSSCMSCEAALQMFVLKFGLQTALSMPAAIHECTCIVKTDTRYEGLRHPAKQEGLLSKQFCLVKP